MPGAFLVGCEEDAGPTEIQALALALGAIRNVAWAGRIGDGVERRILVVLDQDMRDETYHDWLLPVVRAMRFVADAGMVDMARTTRARTAHCQALLDLVERLRPEPPAEIHYGTVGAYAADLREWVRTRDILANEALGRIVGES